jgi:hypothetical protein
VDRLVGVFWSLGGLIEPKSGKRRRPGGVARDLEMDDAKQPNGRDRLDPNPVAASDSASPSIDMDTADAPTPDMPPMVTISAIAVMPVGRVAILSKLGRRVL